MFCRLIVLACVVVIGCTGAEPDRLVIYSGRSKSLVEPLVMKYRETTGIAVDVRYGDTAQLAVALSEEGNRTEADLFWAQDAGALGAMTATGLLRPLPDSILARVMPMHRGSGGRWVATSGRARTLAYSVDRTDSTEMPGSIFDLSGPIYRSRVGWAPANGSFQAFVTAMRQAVGDDRTRAWLDGMRDNEARTYANNTSILQGIANGEVDFGLPNHYYLFRFKAEDPDFPVEQRSFDAGDVGNLLNVAGVGLLAPARKPDAALQFVVHLLRPESQQYFAHETFEYPVVVDSTSGTALAAPTPAISLDELRDLERTLEMLREAALL